MVSFLSLVFRLPIPCLTFPLLGVETLAPFVCAAISSAEPSLQLIFEIDLMRSWLCLCLGLLKTSSTAPHATILFMQHHRDMGARKMEDIEIIRDKQIQNGSFFFLGPDQTPPAQPVDRRLPRVFTKQLRLPKQPENLWK